MYKQLLKHARTETFRNVARAMKSMQISVFSTLIISQVTENVWGNFEV